MTKMLCTLTMEEGQKEIMAMKNKSCELDISTELLKDWKKALYIPWLKSLGLS